MEPTAAVGMPNGGSSVNAGSGVGDLPGAVSPVVSEVEEVVGVLGPIVTVVGGRVNVDDGVSVVVGKDDEEVNL